jgi:hypothetical protein
MTGFTVGGEAVDLPAGAFAHSRRVDVRHDGRHVLSLSQGVWRACLHPVYTPAGVAVTSESPVDHPHHNAVWLAADRVTAHLPFADGASEDGCYNFYVNDTFQGRAPGRIVGTELRHGTHREQSLRLTQQLEWRGPAEWGAPDGRVILQEERVIDIACHGDATILDLQSHLQPTEWDVTLGPTRHAYFGVRVIESLRQSHGGTMSDSTGQVGAEAISGSVSGWVDTTGPVGGGRWAGVALMPHKDSAGHPWFVTDWGTMTVNPLVAAARQARCGDRVTFGARIVTHDGPADGDRLTQLARQVQG